MFIILIIIFILLILSFLKIIKYFYKNNNILSNKIVNIEDFKRKKLLLKKTNEDNNLIKIYESSNIFRVEQVSSILNYNGIKTHIFNRHIGTILIHPVSEIRFLILVHANDKDEANKLIYVNNNYLPPEDSSIA